MSNVLSHKVCLQMISTLNASYNLTNPRRYENNVLMDFEAIKNITSLKKLCETLNTFFLFFLLNEF